MEQGHTIKVLDKGFVRYVESLGTDKTIVNSARVSYHADEAAAHRDKWNNMDEVSRAFLVQNTEKNIASQLAYEFAAMSAIELTNTKPFVWEKIRNEMDKKLLHFLYKNRHTSPFEQCSVTFNIKMPIFVMRQFVRHRTFRLNEMSARYTKMWDDFYEPEKWRMQDNKNKQGSLQTDLLDHQKLSKQLHEFYDLSYKLYEGMIEYGVAKEMARFVLPVANYTEIYVNCDLHNLMHFFRLRLDAHAQLEIRVFAQAMFDITKELYPWTIEAYEKYQVKVQENV